MPKFGMLLVACTLCAFSARAEDIQFQAIEPHQSRRLMDLILSPQGDQVLIDRESSLMDQRLQQIRRDSVDLLSKEGVERVASVKTSVPLYDGEKGEVRLTSFEKIRDTLQSLMREIQQGERTTFSFACGRRGVIHVCNLESTHVYRTERLSCSSQGQTEVHQTNSTPFIVNGDWNELTLAPQIARVRGRSSEKFIPGSQIPGWAEAKAKQCK